MEIKCTEIPGLLIIQPKIFYDARGYFFESYNKIKLSESGFKADFIQDNQSMSSKGTLRGMHFQRPPFEQGKLVTVIKGAVRDIVVDIRKNSKFYGKYFSIELTEQNKTMLWVPPGFAHGFLTLEDNTIFSYKCTQVYNKDSEGAILWNDPDVNINWDIKNPVISEKDNNAPLFKTLNTPF
ncbi:MAG TPA: dTDP-4-dehydrorhamnose 3,5-epimerase [Bacteroidales bacterium]|nr:dTDP-4-dehydrorhamnose 3,5-epimerase [Bacteroidales bacterium]HPS17147.1 dTDP-4-dehydrorhamnose 3,5-epimerase [Bacteroidales bacterium]